MTRLSKDHDLTNEGVAPDWLDALPQAVVLHQGGRVTHLNLAAERLWGVTRARARGRALLEVVRRHTLEALAREGGELDLEVAGRSLHCRAQTSGQNGIQGGALVVEDLTGARRREAELREAAAVLSHEFRTPVTALRGLLEALQYEMPPEMQQNFVAQGLAETLRLARLVDDLAVGFKPVRARVLTLSEVLGRAERLLAQELSQAGVRLVRGEDAAVRADPDKLLQVLLNLIENAARHGPRHGTVRVEARPHGTGEESWVEIAVLSGGEPLLEGEHIWRAHARGAGARGNGSGMGLYIVRSIVEGWGGRAWTERRPGGHNAGFNAFCFTVPGA